MRHNATLYTDAPEPHSTLFIHSLQLICWLLFHPSAWRQHILRIDPNLRPNFVLTELRPDQWRNPKLRRLLTSGYLVLPVITSLIALMIIWFSSPTPANLIVGLGSALAFGLCTMLIGSLTVGVAISMILIIGVGIGGGVVAADLAEQTAINLLGSSTTHLEPQVLVAGFIFGVMAGVTAGVVGMVAHSVVDVEHYSPVRQASAVILGVALAVVMLLLGQSLMNGNVSIAVLGAVVGIINLLVISWRRGLQVGLVVGVLVYVLLGIAFLTNLMAARIILFLALVLPVYTVVRVAAGPWIAIVTSALGGGIGWVMSTAVNYEVSLWPLLPTHLLGIIAGVLLPLWGPLLLYPFIIGWNWLLYRIDAGRSDSDGTLLSWNAAFWNERLPFRLSGLHRHVLLVMERAPDEGQAAIEYLADGSQRWAAQAVQIELDARCLARCETAEEIGLVHRNVAAGGLTGPASALLRSFSRISQDVMAALEQISAYNQRLALSAVEDRLDGLLRELTRSSEPYTVRFRPVAAEWRKIITEHVHHLAETVEIRQELDSPYVIGIPLTEQQEIFVGRTNVSARIEKLLLDRRRPPLLLYGQRRMGKTSLLNNLSRLLPTTIVPIFVDLQGPTSHARDYAGFFYNVARAMVNSAQQRRGLQLPSLAREHLEQDPFTHFDEWLDEVERALGDHTALVTLDEFEALEMAIARGHLDEHELLGMLRHLIQHRPRFKVLITSSQTLDQFRRWSSYLINVQVIHISYLNEDEARQLIERPVRGFPLRYEPDACQRVLSLTRGHPFLIQLLCDEIVALKNEQAPEARRLAQLEDVEAAVPESLDRGSFFFADIEQNQIKYPTALQALKFIAAQGEGAVIKMAALRKHCDSISEQDADHLIQRELIEAVNGGYKFQVELIRRWFTR